MRLVACLVLLLLIPVSGHAEPVEIRADFGQRGQGWLFGSVRDGRCWIALPRHVLGPAEMADPGPFVFDDRRGRSGQSLAPIPVAAVPGAVAAAAGQVDLAFAPVAPGARAPGECQGRLGLAPRMYGIVLARSRDLDLETLQGGSTAMFQVEIIRASNDAAAGATVLLRARNPSDNRYLVGGLSGSVASLLHEGRTYPGAMVLKVDPRDARAIALRFDRIAAAFDVVEAHVAGRATPAPAADIAGTLSGLLGQLEPGAAPLEQVTGTGGCWRIGLAPGQRRVDLMLLVPAGQRVEWLRASLPSDCGAPSVALLEIRHPGGGWQLLTGACPVTHQAESQGGGPPDAASPCRVARTGPFELRLRLPGPAALGRISLD